MLEDESFAFVYELRDNYLPMGAWCAWVAKRPQLVDMRRCNQSWEYIMKYTCRGMLEDEVSHLFTN